ncbi:MAG TPA: hypothetical protein VM802_28930, partial [Chitinophaga sp.]|nr:hypothetical protein [Chitinophaga sp.]
MKTEVLTEASQALNIRAALNPPMAPVIVEVTRSESRAITEIGRTLKKVYGSCDNPEYVSMLHLNAYKILPERIARTLSNLGSDFSLQQYGAIVLKGLVEVDQEELGPTPSNWRDLDAARVVEYGFISSLLHGAVPSKPVEYFAQRKGGGLLHAIIPDENMAYSQTGSGSKTELFVHTEDAFLFNAADFLSFMYLRNEEQVPSMLYSIRSHGAMSPAMRKLLDPIYKC